MPSPDFQIDAAAAKELAADVPALLADRETLLAQLRAVEWKLAMYATATGKAQPPPLRLEGSPATPEPQPAGFRDYVRKIIADAKGGVRPSDIVDAFEKHGYPYSGTSPISLRIY